MRLDIRYRTRFDYDDPVRESQNELRAAPDERSPAAAHLVSGDDDSRVARLLVHRLLGHPGRRVRRPRAARVARGHRRGVGRRRAVRRCSPRRLTSTSVRGDEFREEHLEYLVPTPARRLGTGRGRRGATRARRSTGPDLVSVVLAIHRKVGELDPVPARIDLRGRRGRGRARPRQWACARTSRTSR